MVVQVIWCNVTASGCCPLCRCVGLIRMESNRDNWVERRFVLRLRACPRGCPEAPGARQDMEAAFKATAERQVQEQFDAWSEAALAHSKAKVPCPRCRVDMRYFGCWCNDLEPRKRAE